MNGHSKVLITGASGVIGLRIAKWLRNSSEYIIDLAYRTPLEPKQKLMVSEGFRHYIGDLTEQSYLDSLGGYDCIYHCGGFGQPQKFLQDPEKTFLINTNVLQKLAAKVNPNGHFVFFSTSELYVNSESTKEDEQIVIDPNNKRNCYILGKLFGEYYLRMASHKRNINFKNIRICLCYGPCFRPTDKRALYELIFKAVDSGNISLIDDGSAIRHYIYIDDAIEMICNIVKTGRYDTYNVGGKEKISILEIAKIISRLTNATLEIGIPNNKLADSPKFAGVDIGRYEQEFGPIRFTSLEIGIQKCIDWYGGLR